jgi:hypothetical protein
MKYFCCQPANNYYTWQVEVLINNFINVGVSANTINIVCAINDDIIPSDWVKMKNHYSNVNFFFYNDTRNSKNYIASIYFNLMKQHLKKFPQLKDEVLFIHDSDIIFLGKPNFEKMSFGNSWYLSDTNSYINYDYLISKGNEIYKKMCEIIGIHELIPKLMNSNSGGAQYIVKNTDFEFWEKVEIDSVKLYDYFCEIEPRWDKDFLPIQKWTAGMWSLLWNAWYFGHETIVDKRLNFGWVTESYESAFEKTILHNAGVLNENSGLFYKGKYTNKLPYNDDIIVDKTKASYRYWQEVSDTAKKSILI